MSATKITYNKVPGSTYTAADATEVKNTVNLLATVFNVHSYGATGDGVTDDTVAIQAAIDACVALGGGVVYFPNGHYIVGGVLRSTYNSQLTVPPLAFTSGDYSSIAFVGEWQPTRQGLGAGAGAALAQSRKGVIIESTLTTSSGARPSVFGTTKNGNTRYSNNTIFTRNLKVLTTVDATDKCHMTAFDYGLATACSFEDVVIGLNISTRVAAEPNDDTVGIHMPYSSSNTNMTIKNCLVSGYKHGYVLGEHITLLNVDAFGCYYGFTLTPSTYTNVCTRILAQWCKYCINTDVSDLTTTDAPTINETKCRTIVTCLNVEIDESVLWFNTQYFINDPTNIMVGQVGVAGYAASVMANWSDSLIKNGGADVLTYRLHPDNGATDWTVTGDRSDGTALANLLTTLERRGIIVDSTVA